MNRRRLFGAGLALAAAVPLAWAQQPARRVRIGWLSASAPDPANLRSQVEPFRKGLREHGWVEGQNLAAIEFRWAEGKLERLPALLAELLRLDLDLLVTTSPRPALLAKEAAPKTLPIVALAVDDPVQMGLAADIARPGGNITGTSAAFTGLLAKRLQRLEDIVPSARRLAVVFNPLTVPPKSLADGVPGWEAGLGVSIGLAAVRGTEDFDTAFAALAKERTGGVVSVADPLIWAERAKPGEIAFEQGTKLEFVVNLKGARALGITIPQGVLLQADEVIE